VSLGLRPPRRSKSMAMHSVTVQGCKGGLAACSIQWIVSHVHRAGGRREPVDVCPRVVAAEIRECACPRDVSEAELERTALPDRPLLQGRPPGVSTPVYEKIWSQFKGTHDQRCTERCDVPSRGLGRNRPQPNRGRKPTQSNTQRTAPRRLRARPIEHHPSALPCAHATKYKISHVVCADCRAELGADRPPSAAPHRPCSSVPHPCCVGILRCSEEG
jgi:hypothetical protein